MTLLPNSQSQALQSHLFSGHYTARQCVEDGITFNHTLSLFIYLFGVLRRFQHCTGHIETSTYSSLGFCTVKLPTNGKQLPAFPLEAMPRIEPRPQRWEARVLPLCHHGPHTLSPTCQII